MRRRILSLFVFCLILWSSCYKPETGCLDTFSDNYDVTADEACDDCCSYPELIFRFNHQYDGLTFNRDSAYTDDFGNVYKLNQFEFFISNVSVNGLDGLTLGARDSFDLTVNSGVTRIPNDIAHITNLSFSFASCEIAAAMTTMEVVLDYGIGYDLDGLDFDLLNESNVLKIFEDSLYLGDRFVFGEIELQRDTFLTDVDLILLDHIRVLESQLYNIEIEVDKGDDLIVDLDIDYKSLMTGINVKTDVAADIKQRLTDNFLNAIQRP